MFMTDTLDEWGELLACAHIQGSDTFWGIEFMASHGEKIDPKPIDMNIGFANALGGVTV